ncbi:DUF2115 domain-containing protein [uncultured Methanobrevibacter sp.]|uniref:DUF2115 domain-containing protein n=1 Tax=uncultured Methanobrevibacter sp. TaxID=253161 RepID=UPI0025E234A0|nr:DUF2115 domain-containing protein [uncultured Methanobrevibacter sp.]MEE1134203.1 DUF2115 domain-containing protein [Methanobrevibacter sp.]
MEMYDDFSNVISNEESISCDSILEILKKYSTTISVFDLMAVNAEMIEESKYVQENYKEKSHGVYAKYFLGRLKDINSDNNHYSHPVDKEEFIDAVATLKSYHVNESMTSKTKFPLIYGIISIYTTFVLEEPIHPVGTPFPGSLYVEEHDGVFYCPVKDANLESPNAVCKMCIAEQLDF